MPELGVLMLEPVVPLTVELVLLVGLVLLVELEVLLVELEVLLVELVLLVEEPDEPRSAAPN